MNKLIVIVGAGRQGKNVGEILTLDTTGRSIAGYLDDTKVVGDTIAGCQVLGGFAAMDDPEFVERHAWIVAIGENEARQRICQSLDSRNADFVSAIHPVSLVSASAVLGKGCYLGGYTRVMSDSRIGDWALLEGLCTIGCETQIGEAASLGPGCHITGAGIVGERSFIGAGTVVSNSVRVGSRCVVGANSVVVRNLPDGVRAQGVPAKIVA